MTTLHTVSFQKTVLASLIGLCLSQSAFALQEISDEGLSNATGEGIAFLPTDMSMQFNGAHSTTSTKGNFSDITDNSNPGVGYIHLIPVGPLTKTAMDTNGDGTVNTSDRAVGKADIYLYGLALSQSNKASNVALTDTDWNNRFGKNITSWGTPENPWILKVQTALDVPNFSATSPTDTGKSDVPYLMLEAPLYNTSIPSDTATDAATNGSGAYNLKLGLWADAFVRDPSKVEGDANEFALGAMYGSASNTSRENRLRLQAIWDGFSINGSNIKIFQTLGGASGTKGISTSYNQTFGMAGVLRLNSGDSTGASSRATFTSAMRTNGSWAMDNNSTAYGKPVTFGCGNSANATNFGVARCEYRYRSRTITDTVTNGSWTAPIAANVLRLSTKETTDDSTKLTTTPAINGGVAPSFYAQPTSETAINNDGIYLYNPNINLVLGTLYQPLMLGVADDGKNISLEIARIPNKESIYKKLYTDYDNPSSTTYTGSTCNVHKCGDNGLTGYQGNNATHSSITIGSTVYDASTNSLSAEKGNGAVGISFGALKNRTGINDTRTYKQWQDQQRQIKTDEFNWTDTYRVRKYDSWCGGIIGDNCNATEVAQKYDPYSGQMSCVNNNIGGTWCDRSVVHNGTSQAIGNRNGYNANVVINKGAYSQWSYRTSGNADEGTFNDNNGAYNDFTTYNWNQQANNRDYESDRALSAANMNWDLTSTGGGSGPRTCSDLNSATCTGLANWADVTAKSAGIRGISPDRVPTQENSFKMSPQNNFGSAVIDGLLIQHLKITTKGL